MAKRIVFSFDLEDHRGRYNKYGRFVSNVEKWLDFLDRMDIRGTFFVVASVAINNPGLIRRIFNKGHEIASHSLKHVELTAQNAKMFLASERISKDLLEQAIGHSVLGFRAPVFSLTPKTSWAIEIMGKLGYAYSSSTIPCNNPLNGYPGICKEPFKWKGGIVEFPGPVFSWGPLAMPYLGGIYFRYMPVEFIKMLIKASDGEVLWTYAHPYDIDSSEPFVRFPNTGFLTSLLLWMNRKNCLNKFEKILSLNKKERFIDLAGDEAYRKSLAEQSPIFS